MPRLNCVSGVVISGLLMAGSLGYAQAAAGQDVAGQDAPKSAPTTVLRSTSSLVLVDVVVTDHGRAVHGLERGRFHVIENGT